MLEEVYRGVRVDKPHTSADDLALGMEMGMEHVAKIGTLRDLDLLMTNISGRGLARLRQLTSLRHLEFCLTR